MPQLVVPRVSVAPSVRAAARAHGDDPHPVYGPAAAALADDDLADWVEGLLADTRDGTPRPEGYVPSTHLWWVDGEEFLGRLQVRHRLTPHLRAEGGHVGYHVVAPQRRRGHATAMLRAALPVVAALGIECALLTTDPGNTASRRVIESCGGLLEGRRGDVLRYWLPTSA